MSEYKITKHTRLRTILLKHMKETNPNICSDKIDLLEEDIKTHIRALLHNANELGLEVKCNNWIGDMN